MVYAKRNCSLTFGKVIPAGAAFLTSLRRACSGAP